MRNWHNTDFAIKAMSGPLARHQDVLHSFHNLHQTNRGPLSGDCRCVLAYGTALTDSTA